MSTTHHSQAGDLHTSNIAINLATPVSILITTADPLPADSVSYLELLQLRLVPRQFHKINSFAHPLSVAPSSLVHQDSRYVPVGPQSPCGDLNIDFDLSQPQEVAMSVPGLMEHTDLHTIAGNNK